jgi:4-hydroxy-3-polyprenylbenzoate decarboxylase
LNLHEYLNLLESHGELQRITAEVDPQYEIGEIAQRQLRLGGGPALLFENVKGSDFPLTINLNSTKKRLTLGLGRDPALLGYELVNLLKELQPPSLAKLWRNRGAIRRGLNMRVKKKSSSAVQDFVDTPGDLSTLPVLRCWPKDGGRFITLPLVQTVDPDTLKTNLGMYRMQVYNSRETGMHWQIVRGAEAHAYHTKNGRMPCAVALGGDPALILSAIFPLPEGMEELPFAGLLRGRPQELVKAVSQPLWVPANAEFILEGVIDLEDQRTEGPFGDHFGHYSHAALYPTFKLTALTHRKNAIYPATVVGKPPQEDRVWGEAINEFSAPMLRLMHPEIAGFWTYYEAGFHNLLVVAVQQRHRKEGIKTALGLLGQGQLSLCKVVVLVDADVDPKNFRAMLQEAAKHFDPKEDVLLLPGTPQDTLDFSSPVMNLGSKLILDCTSTRGLAPAGGTKNPKAPKPFNPAALKRVLGSAYQGHESLEGSLLAIRVRSKDRDGRKLLRKVLDKAPLGRHKWVALLSEDVNLKNQTDLIWGLFTRFDAARDIQFSKSSLYGAWPFYQGVLGIDATWKKGYPEPVEMPRSVVKKVDQRWKEYGFK